MGSNPTLITISFARGIHEEERFFVVFEVGDSAETDVVEGGSEKGQKF